MGEGQDNIGYTMNKKVIVIDNFYDEPYEIRRHALQCDYSIGSFVGNRTANGISAEVVNKLTDYNIINSCFEWRPSDSIKSVGIDYVNTLRGIIFLSPHAPINSGISFHRYKELGWDDCYKHNEQAYQLVDEYGTDLTKWDEVDRIGNVFNRLVIYETKYYHSTTNHFGKDVLDSRLIRLIYFKK